jgi:hypothetical protein
MTEKPKVVRMRRPPTQSLISEESNAMLRARLNSAEGQRCLNEFAKLLAEWAAKMMPAEILYAPETEEGVTTAEPVQVLERGAHFL